MLSPLRRIIVAAASWHGTRCRWLFLLFCSPILLPFLCFAFPLLCAAELCIRIFRRSRRKEEEEEEEERRLRRCEEGVCDCGGLVEEGMEVGLLQRYLEDQLMTVYDCGDDDFDSNDTLTPDFDTPLLR